MYALLTKYISKLSEKDGYGLNFLKNVEAKKPTVKCGILAAITIVFHKIRKTLRSLKNWQARQYSLDEIILWRHCCASSQQQDVPLFIPHFSFNCNSDRRRIGPPQGLGFILEGVLAPRRGQDVQGRLIGPPLQGLGQAWMVEVRFCQVRIG